MNRNIQRGKSRGFTLLELVVVVSIIGVLAAIVVPVVTSALGAGQEESYNEEIQRIQTAVDQYFVDKTNPTYQGVKQYPILGASKTGGTFYVAGTDDDTGAGTIAGGISGNPQGGSFGGQPVWYDDGDGVRTSPSEDVLNNETSTSANVGWAVAGPIIVGSTTYYVDSRDYLIDFDLLIALGFLRKTPESAASENCSLSDCSGSYLWYVNSLGGVASLLSSFPIQSASGFQTVFP